MLVLIGMHKNIDLDYNMIKFTYTKNNVVTERYTLTEYYAALRRERLSAQNITWTEEVGVWHDTIADELMGFDSFDLD